MEGLRVVHVGRGREFEFGTGGWVWMKIFEIYLCRRLCFTGIRSPEQLGREDGTASQTASIMS